MTEDFWENFNEARKNWNAITYISLLLLSIFIYAVIHWMNNAVGYGMD